ncbi:hypothetical protein XA68_12617 [Ophiocordyceps unilateralis]|uniref:Phosphatidylinositol-specific phospholipase C X domain-containing protein n=1 Tax=Ophiocordyceps unilateralis TaxID=268505 RepID=A0A2A9PEK0_OPHUN|nr:hypothetical protein XA68_12617 [Ophiocordyceps unilateralis]
MASLAIRNLSIHPLELHAVERIQRVRSGGFFRAVSGLFNGTQSAVPNDDDAPRCELVSLGLPPFTVCPTHVPAPGPGSGLRLTFKAGLGRYVAEVPGSSCRSVVMESLDEEEGVEKKPLRLTVVYLPAAAVLAILSSANLDSWMRDLYDDWPLTLLSIPGTHNSPTCYKALPSVRCQAVGIPDQLRNGIRFLDVRVSANPDDTVLTLVHSLFPVSLTGSKYLEHLLDDVYRFLESNPSEAILLSIKREGTGKATDGQMAKHLKHAYVDKRRERWWTEPKIPTLGQVRGKIVIIRRFSLDDDMRNACWDGRGWAIDAQEWPDNCEDGAGGNGCFRIQDFYEVSESQNIEKKIAYSHSQLERAAEQMFSLAGMPLHEPNDPVPPFFVNFLSASNFFNASCWPERIAAKVNPAAIEYLCVKHGEEGMGPQKLKVGFAGTGIVVTDWVGANDDWDLIRCIVGMNARLQLNTVN